MSICSSRVECQKCEFQMESGVGYGNQPCQLFAHPLAFERSHQFKGLIVLLMLKFNYE